MSTSVGFHGYFTRSYVNIQCQYFKNFTLLAGYVGYTPTAYVGPFYHLTFNFMNTKIYITLRQISTLALMFKTKMLVGIFQSFTLSHL